MEITENQIEHWKRHGYVIVENFLSPEELAEAEENIDRYMPTWEEYVAHRQRYVSMTGNANTPQTPSGWVVNNFPFAGDALNHVALHPFLLGFVERILGYDRLALSHSGLTGKYAGRGDYDQLLHTDYTNNTLAFPGSDTTSVDLPIIVYYTDVTVESGPTYVVSQELTRDFVPGPRHRTREDHPEWYAAEVPVVCPAGSAFIYSMRTFHRGSAMRATEGLRWSHSMAFHTAESRWLGSATFQKAGGSAEMDHFITYATPRQREIVGFPPVADPYWTDETLAGVQDRYPGMDMTPYKW
jgi:ectoine hydroxylase-related dioxygenase (phytanoyl-CoA dioxygenase family)